MLTPRDLSILDALTLRVRVLSVAQIARGWWLESTHSEAAAGGRMKRLEGEGLVIRFTLVSHPELALAAPLAHWRPGDAPPEFGALSHRLKSRWTLPPVPLAAVIATREAGLRFGVKGGRFPKPTEQSHDLHFSAVFLRKRDEEPDCVPRWRFETALLAERFAGEPGELPDAVIEGDPPLAVEFGGAYPRERLEGFHRHCAERALPYEIW